MLLGYANATVMAANLAVVGGAYPVEIRARGVGYAMSWMRIGSGTATLVMGAVLYLSDDSLFAFFGVVAGVALLIAVGALIINFHVPGRLAPILPLSRRQSAVSADGHERVKLP